MLTYSADGLHFDVREHGASGDELVVCLHGFPQDATAFDGVASRLADAGLRVLAPDQRGYSPGARPPGRRRYTLAATTADVVALLDAVGATRAHVVGHDWGGAVAWALAGRHADRLASVTVLATAHPAAMLAATRTSTQALRSAYVAGFQVPAVPEALLLAGGGVLLRQLLVRSGLPRATAEHYVARMREPGALASALAWYRALPLAPRWPVGRSAVPTLYVRGEHEPAITRRAGELSARYARGPYRAVELPGAGHWLPETRPAEVAALVLEQVGRG